MPLITIWRDSSGNLKFDPPSLTLDPVGDFVSWANHDEVDEHQPTLQGKAADYWLDDPLPRFVKGQPAATSPAVTLSPLPQGTTEPVTITYVDGLHPTAASGTIDIPVPPVNTQGGTQ